MAYPVCPKCSHQPLPADQAFPAACPGCGLILAKYSATVIPKASPRAIATGTAAMDATGTGASDDHENSRMSQWLASLLHVPDEVSKTNWYGRIAGLLLFSVWTVLIWRDMDVPVGNPGSYVLHIILTPFHEAGHYLIFRWFGQFIMTLGGTLGQHLFPIVIGIAFLRKGNPFGAAIGLWLLGFSISDMGCYMYDAFDPKLMLLDGRTGAESDGHDWQNIFGDLGLLRQSRGIGLFFGGFGMLVMAAGLAWGAWLVWLQREKLSDSPFAEEEQP
jgi:hypothetical protein